MPGFSVKKFPFIDAMLKGLGQIMLQENALTGFLFLFGIFYDSTTMGIAAILSVFCGSLTARILGYEKEQVQKGLYGFSAALVGVALTFYFQPVFIVWVAIIMGSAAAAVLQHWFIIRKVPVFTLPFVLVTWVIIYLFRQVYPVAPPHLLTATAPDSYYLSAMFGGYGQVIFQGSIFAGIIFFVAVFVNSKISALYGIGGSLLGIVLAICLSQPAEAIGMGLFGYNAVLCALVFAGDKPEDGILAVIAGALSVFIYLIMNKYNLVVLTFPFVVASCCILFVKKYILPSFMKRRIV